MVAMTSFTFLYALRIPGINHHSAPPIIPASTENTHCSEPAPVNTIPVYTAKNEPTTNCPGAPILNNPVLKAKPTDNPVRIIGVAK